jgi:hypothetical protein
VVAQRPEIASKHLRFICRGQELRSTSVLERYLPSPDATELWIHCVVSERPLRRTSSSQDTVSVGNTVTLSCIYQH